MTDQTRGYTAGSTDEKAIVRVEDSAYAVPVAVLEQHRIPEEHRTEVAAALRQRAGEGEGPAEAPLFEMPDETLEAYRLTDEERATLEAQQTEGNGDVRGFGHMGGEHNPYPISGYHGFHQNESFGGLQRGPNGRMVYIGVFPMYREKLPPPAQPGMGLR